MQEKIQKFSQFLMSLFSKLAIIAIIGYIFFGISKSIYKNYSITQKITTTQEDIAKIEADNQNMKNLIMYYQTDSYKELEARRKLGYKKPGESVLIIPDINPTNQNQISITKDEDAKKAAETPNIEKWYQYFMGKKA